MLRLAPLIVRNVLRNRRRSLLTLASTAVSLALLAMVFSIYQGFFYAKPNTSAELLRLWVRHKVSLGQPLPSSYLERIRNVPGVAVASTYTWFGGKYIDNQHFFARFAADEDVGPFWAALSRYSGSGGGDLGFYLDDDHFAYTYATGPKVRPRTEMEFRGLVAADKPDLDAAAVKMAEAAAHISDPAQRGFFFDGAASVFEKHERFADVVTARAGQVHALEALGGAPSGARQGEAGSRTRGETARFPRAARGRQARRGRGDDERDRSAHQGHRGSGILLPSGGGNVRDAPAPRRCGGGEGRRGEGNTGARVREVDRPGDQGARGCGASGDRRGGKDGEETRASRHPCCSEIVSSMSARERSARHAGWPRRLCDR